MSKRKSQVPDNGDKFARSKIIQPNKKRAYLRFNRFEEDGDAKKAELNNQTGNMISQ